MTPQEKANELFGKYYNRVEHTLSQEYSLLEKFVVKQCALIAVQEVIDKDGYNNDYWKEVKQEIEKL